MGRVVNVSSIGGKIGVPHLAPYCASKFALTGLSESLRPELAKDGIYVTGVFPGLMRTGSPFNALFKGRHREEFMWFAISGSVPIVTVDASRAASKLIDACRYGDAEVVIGWPARVAVTLGSRDAWAGRTGRVPRQQVRATRSRGKSSGRKL
jgi:short-subunit dehydrogenase